MSLGERAKLPLVLVGSHFSGRYQASTAVELLPCPFQYIARELDVVGARVREGVSFSSALEARRVFPEVAVKMAEVGESTGALQDMLNTVADFYDEEISTSMERFVTLVEPVLLVIMGIVIAGLLLALYMPLFQLSSVLTN